jgi:hypothetical protein
VRFYYAHARIYRRYIRAPIRIAARNRSFTFLFRNNVIFSREAAARKRERQRREDVERKNAIQAAEAVRRRHATEYDAETKEKEVRENREMKFSVTNSRQNNQTHRDLVEPNVSQHVHLTSSATEASCDSLSFFAWPFSNTSTSKLPNETSRSNQSFRVYSLFGESRTLAPPSFLASLVCECR